MGKGSYNPNPNPNPNPKNPNPNPKNPKRVTLFIEYAWGALALDSPRHRTKQLCKNAKFESVWHCYDFR